MARPITFAAVAGFLVTAVVSLSLATGGVASADEPLSGLRTEEVEAGVLRVVGDAFRDLPTEGRRVDPHVVKQRVSGRPGWQRHAACQRGKSTCSAPPAAIA